MKAELERLQTAYPEAQVQLWAEDEHRVGLKPILRRVYVAEGEQPTAEVHWRYQWLWLYACVRPHSGETYWWSLPYVNTVLFSRVLADFAREFDLGKHQRVLLVVDQAGWHSTQKLVVPDGIHLFPLPAYSPELQPAERLWTLTNEPIANRSFETLDDLEAMLIARCQVLLQQQDLIRGLTGFHWWLQLGA